jgi:excisionase family DNA binding protein
MTPESKKLTASQVAKRLDVTPETVREWARSGKLRAITYPSGRMRFFEDDVEAIEQGGQLPPPPERHAS